MARLRFPRHKICRLLDCMFQIRINAVVVVSIPVFVSNSIPAKGQAMVSPSKSCCDFVSVDEEDVGTYVRVK